jgi:HEPN domain-containing protein
MKDPKQAKEWLKRARSNLARAESGRTSPEVLYEDLCFDAQQAAEKALKALCVAYEIAFPKTHSIDYLIELLEKENIQVPDEVVNAKILTDYAVETRYPGDYEPVDEAEYLEATEIAREVVGWVEELFHRMMSEEYYA